MQCGAAAQEPAGRGGCGDGQGLAQDSRGHERGADFQLGHRRSRVSANPDSNNEVLAAVGRFDPVTFLPDNAIEVFAGGTNGGASPVRVISGPDTGLNCSTCKISITSSPFTGRIYAAVSDLAGATTRILVFAGNASGDARPMQTIEGAATGLAGLAITGIAVSQCDGTIYAMAKSSSTLDDPLLNTGRIYAFARWASGNVQPLRSFTDATTGFADSAGIAITRF